MSMQTAVESFRTLEGIARQLRQHAANFNTGIPEPEVRGGLGHLQIIRDLEEGHYAKLFYNTDGVFEFEIYENHVCLGTFLFRGELADAVMPHLVRMLNRTL